MLLLPSEILTKPFLLDWLTKNGNLASFIGLNASGTRTVNRLFCFSKLVRLALLILFILNRTLGLTTAVTMPPRSDWARSVVRNFLFFVVSITRFSSLTFPSVSLALGIRASLRDSTFASCSCLLVKVMYTSTSEMEDTIAGSSSSFFLFTTVTPVLLSTNTLSTVSGLGIVSGISVSINSVPFNCFVVALCSTPMMSVLSTNWPATLR